MTGKFLSYDLKWEQKSLETNFPIKAKKTKSLKLYLAQQNVSDKSFDNAA
jgi:hypothetical protein